MPYLIRRGPIALVLLILLTAATAAEAQRSERFGPYELHYNVVNTTFLEPAVASQYGITRGRRRAIINLSLREHLDDGSTVARAMVVDGQSWDLTEQRLNFDFQEVREGPAIYYIGEFKFLNREWRYFEFDFVPEGTDRSYNFKFRHQMYTDD